jgi:hypothetical protein
LLKGEGLEGKGKEQNHTKAKKPCPFVSINFIVLDWDPLVYDMGIEYTKVIKPSLLLQYCILVTSGAGITRLLQVLYRINFLTIVLCLCMNRPYQFYYFPPLVSFWYLGQGSLPPPNIVP